MIIIYKVSSENHLTGRRKCHLSPGINIIFHLLGDFGFFILKALKSRYEHTANMTKSKILNHFNYFISQKNNLTICDSNFDSNERKQSQLHRQSNNHDVIFSKSRNTIRNWVFFCIIIWCLVNLNLYCIIVWKIWRFIPP